MDTNNELNNFSQYIGTKLQIKSCSSSDSNTVYYNFEAQIIRIDVHKKLPVYIFAKVYKLDSYGWNEHILIGSLIKIYPEYIDFNITTNNYLQLINNFISNSSFYIENIDYHNSIIDTWNINGINGINGINEINTGNIINEHRPTFRCQNNKLWNIYIKQIINHHELSSNIWKLIDNTVIDGNYDDSDNNIKIDFLIKLGKNINMYINKLKNKLDNKLYNKLDNEL